MKTSEKLMGQSGLLIRAKEGEINDHRNGREMMKYLKKSKEALDREGNNLELAPCAMPTLTDYHYYYLCDQDPDQDVEDDYKKKKDHVFTFRFLRLIGTLDLVNYLGRPEIPDKTRQFLFLGDPEEQARVLYSHKSGEFRKRLIEFKAHQQQQ